MTSNYFNAMVSLCLAVVATIGMIWGALLEFDLTLAAVAHVVGFIGYGCYLLTFPVSLYSVVAALLNQGRGNSPAAWAILPLIVLVVAIALHVKFWGFTIQF